MNKRLILLDQSAMKNSHCSRKLYLTLLKGYRGKLGDMAMEFGQACHIYTKELELSKGDNHLAMKAAVKYYREAKYAIDPKKRYLNEASLLYVTSRFYDDVYSSDPFVSVVGPDGIPLVEHRFALDVFDSDFCHILLCGTMDRICLHKTSGLLTVLDYKTTSSWDVAKYLDDYQTNCQLKVYMYALHRLIEEAEPESFLAQYRGRSIGSVIQGIFYGKEPKDDRAKVEFNKSKVMYFHPDEDAECKRHIDSVCMDIDTMIQMNLEGERDGIYNGTCWNCAFKDACNNEWDKVAQNYVLNSNFTIREYNPMSHGE